MPCDPIDLPNIHPPNTPVPGLVPALPAFDLPFPALPITDLQDLFDKLSTILPVFGSLKPHLSLGPDKTLLDGIKDLLKFLTIFLIPLKMIIPILEMILCIIEILCALNNPFKLVRAIIRLFRVCIPDFLSLFPIFALILFIISLLLLILTLILYLIERILEFIKQIIANILILAEAINSFDNDSVIAIITKIGDVLCLFQGLFVVLGIILLLFEIIQQLLNLRFRLPPCDSNDNSDDGCCTVDVCPSFIKNNRSIFSTTGTLQYFNTVIATGSLLGPITLRNSSYQLYDNAATTATQFNNITHAFDLPSGVSIVFFPTDSNYTVNTPPTQAAYTVDVRFFYDPAVFGRTDAKGARFIRINNCIVLQAPVDGVSDYQNHLIAPFNGTLMIGGGTAFEDDGTTIMKVLSTDDGAGTLNSVINLPIVSGSSPVLSPTDGLKFNIEYTFNINHAILISKTLISLGCHPDVAFNRDFINTTLSAQFNANTLTLQSIKLPDIAGTQECIANAITTFRSNISVETATTLQNTVIGCLNNLQTQTLSVLSDVITGGFDVFKSDFTVDPSIQFTSQTIAVSVSLNESSGTNMATNLPADAAKILAQKINGIITLGELSEFVYDGSSQFVARISSIEPGNGSVKVTFDNQFISILNNPSNINENPSTSIKELTYTFVQSSAISEGKVIRDAGDVARESGNE